MPIVASLLDLYNVNYDETLSMIYASEICLQMAVDKAYGTAMRPKDAPNNVSEALRSPQSEQWQEAIVTD